MTISRSVAVPVCGAQEPRLLTLPGGAVSSSGAETVELAASVGLELDPWQQLVLEGALSERADGQWAAFEVGLIVGRQSGKGSILEARELAGLFLFGERMILHTAHQFNTAKEAFRRIRALIDGSDDLVRKVRQVRQSNEEVSIELLSGQRLRFVARNGGSGRGFTGDCVILDEAFKLGPDEMGALLPTLSARPNPQIWYTSSAPMATSHQLHAVRRRALAGGSPRLAFFEWSIDPAVDDPAAPAAWARANPALGIRISEEFIAGEMAALDAATFARERLGVPDMPLSEVRADPPIPLELWDGCVADAGRPGEGLVWAVDVSPDLQSAAVGVAWRRDDGRVQVQVVDHRPGAGWVAGRVAELRGRWGGVWVLDPRGGSGSLVEGWPGVSVSAADARRWCVLLDAAVRSGGLAHFGQAEVRAGLEGAVRRPSEDGGWSWARRQSTVDISPLVAVSLAHGALAGGVTEQAALPDPLLSVW